MDPFPLETRLTGDGSFSLYCQTTGEGFHSADGALKEAQRVFVGPSELKRFPKGSILRIVEVAVGTGTNTAALLGATLAAGLTLEWWGLELDPRPLALALADPHYRRQWSAPVLKRLEEMVEGERLLWGDARRRLLDLPPVLWGACDLVLLDAFSPQRCPQLWSVEFLAQLARLLQPRGRLLTYCCAAAVRRALALANLQLVAIPAPVLVQGKTLWSGGTVASPEGILNPDFSGGESSGLLRLSPMEMDHMASRAGVPYRDPTGFGSRKEIQERRAMEQMCSGAEPASRWRQRWGLDGRR